MSGRILVSTHDLERAGRLKDAFYDRGYEVELVTPSEDLLEGGDPRLLVLSGAAGTERAEGLVRQAVDRLGVPVIGYGEDEASPPAAPDLLEVFPSATGAGEVALVGRTILERDRLRDLTGIVGDTEAMREVLERIIQIAPVDSTVLLTGESGTGKELVARGIHGLSPRRHKPFIAVNVAALSETLLESELFGHEKGAFTGAVDSRKGLFELADQGTIFLDEIGEMPLTTQTKLLRVLEQREFLRVGGERDIHVDVRIITATNQDLRQLVAIGEFRRDLYYRLNVLRIELPPLRERTEDIPRLVEAFVREAAERHDRPRVEISPDAMNILESHHWPGNVRELRNLVESMVVLAPGREIRPNDIPPEVRGTAPGRALVPAPIPRPPAGDEARRSELRPEIEFIFRTLVELRMDVDDLRKEFDSYRDGVGSWALRGAGEIRLPAPGEEESGVREAPAEREAPERGTESPEVEGAGDSPEVGARGTVVFEPGMTIEEMERRAIEAALREVDGNRRMAAEMLGIGERTLYRKIKRYDLDG
ncbi:MAG: sigma-54 dependent transcriptional regulator [Gemmatimonadota bacterium]